MKKYHHYAGGNGPHRLLPLLLIVCLFTGLALFPAQLTAQTLQWAKSLGGSSLEVGRSVAVDAAGNVYTTGYFTETADFDPSLGISTLISAGALDIFITKFTTSGDLVWARSIGGINNDVGFSVAVDAAGNVYTTGSFQGIVDVDPGSGTINFTSAGSSDIFVIKFNASGELVWAKSIGDSNADIGRSITVDAAGNVYTTGSFQGMVDVDPGPGTINLTSAGSSDIFVIKFNASGELVWARNVGGSSFDGGNAVAVDAVGNVYLTGYFIGTVDFDPGTSTSNLTSMGREDIFITKLNAAGSLVWARSIGGSSVEEGQSVALDPGGNIFLTGFFRGTVDADPGPDNTLLTSAGSQDIFVSKLDASGNLHWARNMGGSSGDVGYSVALDDAGNIYLTGSFAETVDFDPGPGTTPLSSAGIEDFFVVKLLDDILLTDVAVTPATVCADNPLTFTANVGNVTGTYAFTLTNGIEPITGSTISPAFNQSLTATGSGTQSYTLTVAQNGRINSSVISLTVNVPPTASIAAPSTTLTCTNPTATLTASGEGTYRWDDGSTSATRTVNSAGTYSLTVTTTNGCAATASVGVSEDKTSPVVSLAASGSVTCANPTVTLTASPAGQGTYRFAGPGLNQAGTGNTASISAGGLYSVTLTGTNGCTATATTTVESATNAVNATLVASGSISCSNPTVLLTAAPAGASYAFTGPGLSQTGATNTATVSTAGTYSVVVTGVGGCSALATVSVTGSTTAPPLTINAAPAPAVAQGQSVTLTATGGANYQWNTGASSSAIQPPTSATGSTVYSVTGTAPNGCSATAQFTLTVLNPPVFCGADPSTLGTPLTLLEPAYNCSTGQIQFRVSGGNGTPITYAAIGITAPTTSCSATVDTQLAQDIRNQSPNVEPFTILATQNGITVSLRWDARATCAGGGGNTPPTLANAVGPQSATLGVGYSLNVGSVFTDAQTPASLVLSATGLPAGLALTGNTLTGTPSLSGVSTITLTATDPGGLTNSTSFQLTVSPVASQTTTPPPAGSALAATLVSYNCPAGAITFGFTGGNGAPVEYLAIGVTGWTTNPSHVVEAGLRLDPKPITIRVRQNGVEGTPFVFDFGAFCAGNPQPPTNTAPSVANTVGPQSATVGVGYSLNVGSVFADAQTPTGLVLTASGLPAGLALNGGTISGTPSMTGVSTVILTATDAGGLSNSTSFVLTVSPAGSTTSTPPVGGPLAATVVSYNCQTGAITFGSTGGNGSAVEYFAIGITGWTTNVTGMIEAGLRADPKPVTIRVRQNGVEGTPVVFDFGAFCSRPARVATETVSELDVVVLGNPTPESWVEVQVANPAGEALQLRVISAQGRLLNSQEVAPTSHFIRQRVQLGTDAGTYLLQVATPTRIKTVKVVRQ